MLQRLSDAGVQASALGICTYAREADCFSYRRTTHRRETDYGRQIAVIAADHI
jgi:polyphenol oxidase